MAVAQAARDLDVHENVMRKWIRDATVDPQHAFPGQGIMRPSSQRSPAGEVLGSQVRQSFLGGDRIYVARRVWHDVLALGQQCGLHRIERLMREQSLRAKPRRRGLPQDRDQRSAIADNVLDRQFQADAPNQKWVADFTYIWTAEGWLYAAAALDLY